VLDQIFRRVLETFADIDLADNAKSPTIFLVYAHDNRSVGNADAELARDLIYWLGVIRSKVISDRSPSLEPWVTREDSDSFRDILSNQFCLLPKRDNIRRVYDFSNVDKVILCCSEVLQNYYEDSRMKAYTTTIREFYLRSKTDLKSTDEIKKGIEGIVKLYYDKEGFHHVLTELAFLEIRYIEEERHHGIIPVLLNGGSIKYLPFQNSGIPLWLKPQGQSKSMIHERQVLHRLLFNLLLQIYEGHHASIKKFEECYKNCAKRLAPGSILPLQEEFDLLISTEIALTSGQLASSHVATLRKR
jgi:hypothetical protein